tara:strand:+ start:734 stop:1888 length:1155 start_codon:yes stop_codon:yes gene_type:complete
MANQWILHARRYQKVHGCSYRDALKHAGPSYRRRMRYRAGAQDEAADDGAGALPLAAVDGARADDGAGAVPSALAATASQSDGAQRAAPDTGGTQPATAPQPAGGAAVDPSRVAAQAKTLMTAVLKAIGGAAALGMGGVFLALTFKVFETISYLTKPLAIFSSRFQRKAQQLVLAGQFAVVAVLITKHVIVSIYRRRINQGGSEEHGAISVIVDIVDDVLRQTATRLKRQAYFGVESISMEDRIKRFIPFAETKLTGLVNVIKEYIQPRPPPNDQSLREKHATFKSLLEKYNLGSEEVFDLASLKSAYKVLAAKIRRNKDKAEEYNEMEKTLQDVNIAKQDLEAEFEARQPFDAKAMIRDTLLNFWTAGGGSESDQRGGSKSSA